VNFQEEIFIHNLLVKQVEKQGFSSVAALAYKSESMQSEQAIFLVSEGVLRAFRLPTFLQYHAPVIHSCMSLTSFKLGKEIEVLPRYVEVIVTAAGNIYYLVIVQTRQSDGTTRQKMIILKAEEGSAELELKEIFQFEDSEQVFKFKVFKLDRQVEGCLKQFYFINALSCQF